MVAGIAHDLVWGIEAHRLGIEQCTAKGIGVPALHPGRGIGNQRKARRMALRKTVGAEAFKLSEGAFGEFALIAIGDHALDQLGAELRNPTSVFECCHGASKLVGFSGGEAGAFDGDPHGLFLKQRHAERLAQYRFQLGFRIRHIFLALASAQIGMDHIALDRPGPDDRDLDDEIIEGTWLDARQHRHLRAAFDLEGAERVCLADHRIGARVLGGNGGEIQPDILVFRQQIEGAAHTGKHAERQHIDFHEFENVDIVLVPFDDLPVFHGRRLYRHQFVEPVTGQDKAARMLGEMARCADELPRKLQSKPQPSVAHIEVQFLGVLFLDALGPAPDLGRQRLGQVLGQAERLADVAERSFGAIADDGGTERGTIAAIGLIDPLYDFLSAFVLEIDIDVRGLAPFL